MLLGTVVGEDRIEADHRLDRVRRLFEYTGTRADWARERGPLWISGTPEEARATVAGFELAGATRVIFQDFLSGEPEMIDLLGELATAWTSMGF